MFAQKKKDLNRLHSRSLIVENHHGILIHTSGKYGFLISISRLV